MKKPIGIVLIILALILGYLGITKVSNSGSSIKIVGIELSATDEGKKTEGFIYLGLALVSFIGGVSIVNKKGE